MMDMDAFSGILWGGNHKLHNITSKTNNNRTQYRWNFL